MGCGQSVAAEPSARPRASAGPSVRSNQLMRGHVFGGRLSDPSAFVQHGMARLSRMESSPMISPKSEADLIVLKSCVSSSTLLGALPADQLDLLLGHVHVKRVPPGEMIDVSDCMCVVLDGQLQGGERDSRYGVGSVLGELALLHSGASGAETRAVALEPSRVCLLTRDVYNKRLEHARCGSTTPDEVATSSLPCLHILHHHGIETAAPCSCPAPPFLANPVMGVS